MADLRIAAAASLVPSLEAMRNQLDTDHDIQEVVIEAGSSGSLADLIINNQLNVDVFFSAAEAPMEDLINENLVNRADKTNLLRNSLVLIRNMVNKPATQNIISFGHVDAVNTANVRIFIPEPGYFNSTPYKVPAGIYAERAFNYFDNWGFAGLPAHRVNDATPPEAIFSVTNALNLIAGHGTAAIGTVYFTDAMTRRDDVEIIAIAPPTVNVDIIYPVAKLATTIAPPNVVTTFLNFITNPHPTQGGLHYFYDHGFLPLTSQN